MMHQESGIWSDTRHAVGEGLGPIAVLAYRSRAVAAPGRVDLDAILRRAQQRNRSEGITGLLIYEDGHFFQWLEGPKLGVMRVWDSIRRDPRHVDLKVLRQQNVASRFFKDWDMRLARRARGDVHEVMSAMEAPQELLSRLRTQPSVLDGGAWEQVFADVVIPRLQAGRISAKPPTVRPLAIAAAATASSAAIWHADHRAGAELASVLLAVDGTDTARYVDRLVDQGAGLEPLFQEVFEPAARCLGGLWDDDRCDEFNVTLAMGRLQIEVHRLSHVLSPAHYTAQPGHAILLAPQPGEVHGLSATMGAELFLRGGWDVSNEILGSDQMLRDLLHEQWFDVLELSLSAAMRRDQQLSALRFTIRTARAASLNPALAVIVDGRSFFERPDAYLDVGADVGCRTSIDAVPAAQKLLDALGARSGSRRSISLSDFMDDTSAVRRPPARAIYRFRPSPAP